MRLVMTFLGERTPVVGRTRLRAREHTMDLLTAIISHFDRQLLGNKLSFAPCSIHILPNPNKFHKLWWFEMFCSIMLRIYKKQH